MKRILIALVVLGLAAGFTSCSREKSEAKNMEQIYKEEGVPVRTITIAPTEFKTVLSFNSILTGLQESTAYAPMGDKVEKVLVNVGDYVKKDTVVVRFPMDSPSAQYYQAKVGFENAKTAYERIENLYKTGGISLQERDNAKARYDVAAANWDTVGKMVEIKAPIGGYVTKVHVAETDNVDKEMPLVTIARTDKMKTALSISEKEIFDIKEGMPASAAWMGSEIEGKVTQVDMAMNPLTKSFRSLVEFDNPGNLLKAGITVEIHITTSSKPNTIVVERKDLLKQEDKYFVFVVKDNKAEKRNVTVGKQQVLDIEILEGLNPGDEMVVEGQMLLENGSKVRIIRGN